MVVRHHYWYFSDMMVALPLAAPPAPAALSVGVHGRSGRLNDRFRLPDLWAVHLYRYRAELTLDGEVHQLAPGSVSLVPPGVITDYRYRGVSEHLYAHLRLPKPSQEQAYQVLPAVFDAGHAVAELTDLLLGAITAFVSRPSEAVAYLWAALWRMSAIGSASAPAADPARMRIAPALARVESGLSGPIPVSELAELAGVSTTHLTRLFRQVTGDTVVGYMRRRRLAQAEHLLRNTTLPVATVAHTVGFGDLQAFNKACRAQLGRPPTVIRSAAQTAAPTTVPSHLPSHLPSPETARKS